MDKCRDLIEQNLFDVADSNPTDLSYLKRAVDSVLYRFQGLIKPSPDNFSNEVTKSKENKSKINAERSQKDNNSNNPCSCYHFQYPVCKKHPASQPQIPPNDPSPVIECKKDEDEHQKTQDKCNSSKEEICRLCGLPRYIDTQSCDKNKVQFCKDNNEEMLNVEKTHIPSDDEATQEFVPFTNSRDCYNTQPYCEETEFVKALRKCCTPKPKHKKYVKNSSDSSSEDIICELKLTTNNDYASTDAVCEECSQCSSVNSELWSHYTPVLKTLQSKDNSTTDIVILLGSEEFYAHKVMLSAYSEYFHHHLLKKDRHCFDITAEGVTVQGFHLAIKWMYTGQVEMTQENIGHLWTVAKRLGIKRLCKLCKQQLRKMIRQHGKEIVENLISDQEVGAHDCAVVVLEEEKKCHERKHSRPKIRASANIQLLLDCGDFVYWSCNQICRFLTNDNLEIKSEKQVFDMAAAWLRHGWPQRKTYVTQIMNCVRFPLMTQKEIKESFTHHCNKILWTNKEVITNVLIAYLAHNEKVSKNNRGSSKKKRHILHVCDQS